MITTICANVSFRSEITHNKYSTYRLSIVIQSQCRLLPPSLEITLATTHFRKLAVVCIILCYRKISKASLYGNTLWNVYWCKSHIIDLQHCQLRTGFNKSSSYVSVHQSPIFTFLGQFVKHSPFCFFQIVCMSFVQRFYNLPCLILRLSRWYMVIY